jgi:hypothetical protein
MKMGSCDRVAVDSPMPLCIHLDGEFLCQPGDAVATVSLAVRTKGLRVEAYRPGMYGKWK